MGKRWIAPQFVRVRVLMQCFFVVVCSAAFFHGQVEQPVRGLMSLVSHKDIAVLIGINEKGVYIIDHYESVSVGFYRQEVIANKP